MRGIKNIDGEDFMDLIYKFRGSVNSDLSKVKPFLDSMMYDLNNFIFNQDTLFDIKLILDELIINSVLHGNNKDCLKNVYLSVNLLKDSIVIKVKDEGCGITYNFNDYDFKNLKCSGRGLLLVKALTDSLVLNNNEVIVKKKL